MKILFIKPPGSYHNAFPPIGLVQLATCCKGVAEVKILDCPKEKYSHKEFKDYIERHNFDIAAISALSEEGVSAIECAKIIKKKDKSITTIFGGSHLHNLYHTAGLDFSSNNGVNCIDYAIVGEAEESLPLLLEELKKSSNERDFDKIKGLSYAFNGKIITNNPMLIENLDDLPICDWSLIDLKSYPRSIHAKRYPYAPTLTSRGCPYQCTFCSIPSVSGRKLRPRSPEKIVQEMIYLYNLGIKEVMFWDDNFTLYRKRAIEICDLLIKEDMDLIWSCPQGIRVDLVDEELLKKMKKSGCHYVALGIESGSDKILKDMKKNLTVQKIKENVPLIKKMGIDTWGFFILGYPTESREDILKSIQLSRQLNLTRASFHLYQPVPGTEAFDTFIANKDIKWNKSNKYSESIIAPQGMTPEDLIRLQRIALLRFYLRPRALFRLLRDNSSAHQLTQVFRIFKEYVIHKKNKNKQSSNNTISTSEIITN